jgi:hypothetical protein
LLCAVEKQCGLNFSIPADRDELESEKLSKNREKIAEKIGKAVIAIFIAEIFKDSPLALLSAVI